MRLSRCDANYLPGLHELFSLESHVQSFGPWKAELRESAILGVSKEFCSMEAACSANPTAVKLSSTIYTAMALEILRKMPTARQTDEKGALEQLQKFTGYATQTLKTKKDTVPKEVVTKIEKTLKDWDIPLPFYHHNFCVSMC